MKESDIQDVYESIREKEEKKEGDTLTKVPVNVKGWFIAGIGTTIVFMFTGFITVKTGIIIIVIALLALKFIYGDITGSRELTERELAGMLYNNLKYEQIHSVDGVHRIAPHLVVTVERAGRRVRYNGVPQERRILVSFFDARTRIKEYWEYAVDLYTGDIVKADPLPGGPGQFDTRDVKVIVGEDIKEKKRLYGEMGIKPRKPSL